MSVVITWAFEWRAYFQTFSHLEPQPTLPKCGHAPVCGVVFRCDNAAKVRRRICAMLIHEKAVAFADCLAIWHKDGCGAPLGVLGNRSRVSIRRTDFASTKEPFYGRGVDGRNGGGHPPFQLGILFCRLQIFDPLRG